MSELKQALMQINRILSDDYNFYLELDSLKKTIYNKIYIVTLACFVSWCWILLSVLISKSLDNWLNWIVPFMFFMFYSLSWSLWWFIYSPLESFSRNVLAIDHEFVKAREEFKIKQKYKLFLINQETIVSLIVFFFLLIANPVQLIVPFSALNVQMVLSGSLYFWLCPLINLGLDKIKFFKYNFWRGRDEFEVSNVTYYYLFPERFNNKWTKFLEKIGRYQQAQEFVVAEIDELKSLKKDVVNNLTINTLLMIPRRKDLMELVVNNTGFALDRKTLLWIGSRILNKEINLNRKTDALRYELQQAIIQLESGRRFSFWDLAVISQEPELVEQLYTPGIEYLPNVDGISIISRVYSSELRKWFKENTGIYRKSYLPLLDGWDDSKVLIGCGSIPKLQFDRKEYLNWESLNINNKRLQKIFYEKLMVPLKLSTGQNVLKSSSLDSSGSDLKGIHANLVNLIMELKDYSFDWNIVANLTEKTNFTDLAFNHGGGIWLNSGLYELEGRKVSLFGAYLFQLLKFYSPKKVLKILYNSLDLEDIRWMESLNSWLRIERNPDLFAAPGLPNKVKDISVLQKHFNFVINHCQNPQLELDQELVLSLSGVEFKYWTIHVPNKNEELIEVGSKFKVCLGNGVYYEKIKRKHSFILFLKYNQQTEYVVEVSSNGELIQARGSGNVLLSWDDRQDLSIFLTQIIPRTMA